MQLQEHSLVRNPLVHKPRVFFEILKKLWFANRRNRGRLFFTYKQLLVGLSPKLSIHAVVDFGNFVEKSSLYL